MNSGQCCQHSQAVWRTHTHVTRTIPCFAFITFLHRHSPASSAVAAFAAPTAIAVLLPNNAACTAQPRHPWLDTAVPCDRNRSIRIY